jgi:outer membrane lipoprotein-sorting protein
MEAGIMWMRSRTAIVALALVLMAALPAQARVVKGAAADKIAADAAAFIGSIKTLSASFDFITVKGKTTGFIFMDRARHAIRMQFGDPLNHLLLVDGPKTMFYGGDGTVVQVSTAGTPLSFLLNPKSGLKDNIQVLEVDERGNRVFVAVAERGNVAAGQAVLHFEREPKWRLIDWGVYDDQGRFSKTVLGNQQIGLRLDPALFKAPE